MKTFWLIAAAVCGVVALYFAYVGNYDNAFVAAALGGVAWILNYRTQLKEKFKDEDEEEES
ncbi:MAG TPA: hypothetical protein VFY51_07780 [Pyrinomonadaceae bacterium]|nr:hypothetical protein [Pyrinomonadaceae bacterium]